MELVKDESHDYGQVKVLPSKGLHLCASCTSLLTFDGLTRASSARGFVHSTIGSHVSKIRSIPNSCGICWRVQGLAGHSGVSLLVFRARMSTDEGDTFSAKPEKTRYGLAPFDKLIAGVQEPDDDEGSSFQPLDVDFIPVAPFGKFNPNCY
jgi:hypothetical protein